MDTNLTNINFLTDNNVGDYNPQISDKNVVWSSDDGDDHELYFYDHNNASVTQLTDNDSYESNPGISGNNVIWSAYDGNDNEIYLYNGSETIQLTDNDVSDNNPKIDGNNIAWLSYDGSSNYRGPTNTNIYFYNGSETIQLTDTDTYKYDFSLSGDRVVWSANDGKDSEIYFYNGNDTVKLTTNSTGDYNPQISGDNIVWTGYDENGSEIYLYNGTETIQLTDNDTYESSPQISGNNVVWSANDGNDSEIYFYNGSEIIQLTDNDTYDYGFQISGDNVVWSSNDGNDNEIYLNFSPNLTPGEISGYKWHDLNENGQQDADEPGIEGWTIYLDRNQNGLLDEGETSTVTDADGFYSFGDLRFGTHTVAEQNEPRWSQTHPFAYEYEWQDSKQPDGITYDWVDISGVGTELNLGDDEAAEVVLPFSFDFYGETHDTVNVSSNGYLTFGDNGTENYNNPITRSYNVSNFIAPFWDDLNPAHSGSIYHHYDAAEDRFIVQYQDVARYEVEGSLTFQTILHSDGSIVYQYNDMDATLDSATVGLENADGTRGLQIIHDGNYVENELAVSFTPVRSSDTINSHDVFVGTGETVENLNFGNSLQALRVEAEDYQDYFDLTAGNAGGEYREDDVDLGTSQDVGTGFTVGWIESGEWLTYNLDIPEDGIYKVVARVASAVDTSHSLDLAIDGVGTTVNFDGTGGWESWEDAVAGKFELTAGSHELRLDMGSSGFNLNYIDLITPEDLRIEAEDYQDYYDNTYENQGGAYRDDGVDIGTTEDIGGGFTVGWIESGEWLTYNVDIPQDGNYQIVARVASDVDLSHSLNVSIADRFTTLNFGDTGGWESWEDAVGDDLYLTAGNHELRLDMGSYGFNVNYVDLLPDHNSVNAIPAADEMVASNLDDTF